jgi:hypothetical protein
MDATRLIALVSQAQGLTPIVRTEITGLLDSGRASDANLASDLARMLADFALATEVAIENLDATITQTLDLLCPNARQDAAQVFAVGQFVTLKGPGGPVYRVLATEPDGSVWAVSRDFAGSAAWKYAPSEIAPLLKVEGENLAGRAVYVDFIERAGRFYVGRVVEDEGGQEVWVQFWERDEIERRVRTEYVDRSYLTLVGDHEFDRGERVMALCQDTVLTGKITGGWDEADMSILVEGEDVPRSIFREYVFPTH